MSGEFEISVSIHFSQDKPILKPSLCILLLVNVMPESHIYFTTDEIIEKTTTKLMKLKVA